MRMIRARIENEVSNLKVKPLGLDRQDRDAMLDVKLAMQMVLRLLMEIDQRIRLARVSLFDRLSLAQRSLIPSIIGFLFYGLWAFAVNIMHGSFIALKAACVQGSYSFVVTLFMTIMLEVMYKLCIKLTGKRAISAIFTVIVTCIPVFVGSWMVNLVAGTPEIFNTVILGYVVGAAYSITYIVGLLKIRPQ